MKTIIQIAVAVFLCACAPSFARDCAQEQKPSAAAALSAVTSRCCAETSELFRAAEAKVRRLDQPDRMLLNEFLRGKKPCCFKYSYFYRAPQAFVWNDRTGRLRSEVIDPYFVPDRAALLLDSRFLTRVAAIREDRAQTHTLRSAAAAVLRLSDELGVYPGTVCQKRAAKSPESAAASVAQTQPVQEAVPSEPGTVLAVAADGGRSLCMLESVEVILGEGDTIDEGFGRGVKVVKIESGQVEFKKGRGAWVQKVGEAPSDEWK